MKNIYSLLVIVLFLELGEKMGERFLPIYIIALGGSAIAISLLNGLDNFFSAVYSFPGGYLSDKIGYKRSLVIFDLFAMLGYLIVILFPTWYATLIGAVFFISWSAVSLPAIMSAISKLLPQNKRTMGVTLHSLVRRVPMALGPLLGGACITLWGEINGIRVAFAIAFILAFIAIWIQKNFVKEEAFVQKKIEKSPIKILISMDTNLKRLLVSDILIRFCEQIPYAFVVVWCVKNIGISPIKFGLLTTIEMITAMLVYVPVAYMVEKTRKKPFIAITFAFFTMFPVVLMYSGSMAALVFAFIIRGLKEFGEPTRKALILDLADDNSKAAMYGTYYLVRDIIVSVAAFAAGFLWQISPQTNFVCAFIFGIIGTAYYVLFCGEERKKTSLIN
jgi:MFS family permease